MLPAALFPDDADQPASQANRITVDRQNMRWLGPGFGLFCSGRRCGFRRDRDGRRNLFCSLRRRIFILAGIQLGIEFFNQCLVAGHRSGGPATTAPEGQPHKTAPQQQNRLRLGNVTSDFEKCHITDNRCT